MGKIAGLFVVLSLLTVVMLLAGNNHGTGAVNRLELEKSQLELAEMFVFPFLASYEISNVPAGRDIEWAFEHYVSGKRSDVIASGGLTTMNTESIAMLFSIQDVLGTPQNFMSISFRTSSGTAKQNKVFDFPATVSAWGWKGAERVAIPDEGTIIVVAGVMSSSSLVPVDSEIFSGSEDAFEDLLKNEHVFLLSLSVKESTLHMQNQ